MNDQRTADHPETPEEPETAESAPGPQPGAPGGDPRTTIAGRYEVNLDYRKRLEDKGLVFTGLSPDGVLPETIEYPDHPWFIGVQYHPELKSRPFDPHPLFRSFIEAAKAQSRLV